MQGFVQFLVFRKSCANSLWIIFQEKGFSYYTLLNDQILLPDCLREILCGILGKICIATICCPGRDSKYLKINFVHVINPFSYLT